MTMSLRYWAIVYVPDARGVLPREDLTGRSTANRSTPCAEGRFGKGAICKNFRFDGIKDRIRIVDASGERDMFVVVSIGESGDDPSANWVNVSPIDRPGGLPPDWGDYDIYPDTTGVTIKFRNWAEIERWYRIEWDERFSIAGVVQSAWALNEKGEKASALQIHEL
jgi:hypothetical protein